MQLASYSYTYLYATYNHVHIVKFHRFAVPVSYKLLQRLMLQSWCQAWCPTATSNDTSSYFEASGDMWIIRSKLCSSSSTSHLDKIIEYSYNKIWPQFVWHPYFDCNVPKFEIESSGLCITILIVIHLVAHELTVMVFHHYSCRSILDCNCKTY